jgi:hypothetical protein
MVAPAMSPGSYDIKCQCSTSHHEHHRIKSSLEPLTTAVTIAKRTGAISVPDSATTGAAESHRKMTEVGIEFDPTRMCGTHQTLARFNAVTEIAVKRHLQIQSVTDLLRKFREHRGPVPTHFSWEQGNWRELCEGGCVD